MKTRYFTYIKKVVKEEKGKYKTISFKFKTLIVLVKIEKGLSLCI